MIFFLNEIHFSKGSRVKKGHLEKKCNFKKQNSYWTLNLYLVQYIPKYLKKKKMKNFIAIYYLVKLHYYFTNKIVDFPKDKVCYSKTFHT